MTNQLTTTTPAKAICAYCPDFDPRAASNRGASHGICPACQVKLHAELDAAGFAR